jgi:hypothetical protein
MADKNLLLVLAAAMCGPHRTYRDAITALRTHPNPRIARLANSCTRESLENRLRPYRALMLRRWPPGIEFLDPTGAAALRFVHLALPYLPDDPDIHAAMLELLSAVGVHHDLAAKIMDRVQ